MVKRFEVYLVNLDASPSADARNTRPCVVVSPNEMNTNLHTVIIAPLSSKGVRFPTRVPVEFLNGERAIILDQIRAVDKVRLVKRIGEIDDNAKKATIERLLEIFAE